jgi:hypothetical protein
MVHHLGPELFSGNVAEKQGQIIMIQRNPSPNLLTSEMAMSENGV